MKNFIKITMLALFISTSAVAQEGFFVGIAARTNDVVETPTVGQLEPEVGYMGKHLGGSFVAYTNTRVQTSKVLAYGAKIYVPLFGADALKFMFGAEALYLKNERPSLRNWAFTPDLTVSTPVYGRLYASFSVLGVYHREVFRDWSVKDQRVIIDRWRICNPGAAFKVVYSLGK